MALLRQKGSKIYISIENSVHVFDKTTSEVKSCKLPDIVLPENATKGQEEVYKREDKHVSCLTVCPFSDHIAVSTQTKQIVIFDDDLQVVKNFVLNRTASKIRFTPDNGLLIADKTGDAFFYKYDKNAELTLLLGHLSMLLDITLSDCRKYVITCDRDEKIRVSFYPNSYNILSFCLGHKEFVTNVEVCNDILISASGDGTLRFWNYKLGKQLKMIDTNDEIKDETVLTRFCTKMDLDKVDVKALPITDMQIYNGNDKTFIAVTLLDLNEIKIYSMQGDITNLNVTNVQTIDINCKLITFSLNENLYLLTENSLISYILTRDSYVLQNDEELTKFYRNNTGMFIKNNSPQDISVLYKRKFDNVQEYLERKKIRLAGELTS